MLACTDAAVMQCERLLAEKSRSFSLASRLLDSRTRAAVTVIYAFLRTVDDAIDLAPLEKRGAALARVRSQIADVFAGPSTGDITVDTFALVVREYQIPRAYVEELVAGMAMDVERAHYETKEDLYLYAFRVAGVVGLILCHVMGLRDQRALPNAAHLGIAMQITNICRDIDEDLKDGRVYVPRSVLGFELARRSEVDGSVRAKMASAVRDLLADADRFYASADAAIDELPFSSALAVRAARYIYAAIGDRLLGQGADPFAGRAFVSSTRKLFLVLRAVVVTSARALTRRGRRVSPARVMTFSEVASLSSEETVA